MIRFIAIIVSLFIVSACQNSGTVRVEPRSLLSSSSENVSFALTNSASIDAVLNWIADDKPTQANISCSENDMICLDTQKELRSRSVPVRIFKSADAVNSVELIYERITARNCSHGLGCSMSVNSLNMVADRSYFIRPPISDPHDAGKAVENYNSYFGK